MQQVIFHNFNTTFITIFSSTIANVTYCDISIFLKILGG